MWEVDYRIQTGRYITLLYGSWSCVQWEDETVWTRLETQIDGAARLIKICSEHAGRQRSIYTDVSSCSDATTLHS